LVTAAANTGTIVNETASDESIAKQMVRASGRNILPSSDWSVKSGTNTTTMIRIANVIGRATSRTAAREISARVRSLRASSPMCRVIFSATMIAASTTIPIAMTRPPRLIRLADTSAQSIRMNVAAAVSGRDKATVSAARRSHRSRNRMAITKRPPCSNALDTVRMQAWIRSVRS